MRTDANKLQEFIDSDNIAATLTDEELTKIGAATKKGYDVDLASRSDIDEVNKKAVALANQVYEQKDTPWPGAANVKYPLITVASIQFASRAFPELIPDETIVGAKVIGKDAEGEKQKKADRVGQYMDWQLTEGIPGWLDGTDRLLHSIPITGCSFRKIWYDNIKGRIVSKYLSYDDVVVNKNAESLEEARRVSHKIYKHQNYVHEMVAAGLWQDVEIGPAPTIDGDEESPHFFVEQHRWLDLDEDGYEEPYVVTIHYDTGKVMRIVARYDEQMLVLKAGALVRIEPVQYFIKYPFIPNPGGGFYDIGFGSLLYPINESINTTINQLLDAGTLANTGGGFLARGVRIKSGGSTFKPGEWKKTDILGGDLRAGVFPLPIKEPSQVLFQLLGLLVSAGRDISSVQESMSGQKPGENVSEGTVVALIEQGLKVFSGIYKRLFRAFTQEFKLMYYLNSRYMQLEEYIDILDEIIKKSDFDSKENDIVPSADPQFSLDSQRVAKSEAMIKMSGRPGVNEDNVTKMYLKAIKVPDNMYVEPEDRPPAPPNVELETLKLEQAKFELESKEANLRRMKLFAEVEELRAKALGHIAKAEGQEAGIQLDEYKLFLEDLGTRMKGMMGDGKEGVRGMAPASGNGGGPQNNAGNPG